jgi:ABC-type iron transport system FetAB permease component
MLAGATIAGVVVSITIVLKEVVENKDKIETCLAFGASRREACTPIARHALRMALMPTVNQMRSVIFLPENIPSQFK